MAEPADLLKAWQEAIKQLRGAAAPVAGVSEDVVRQMIAPLQRQAELLEDALSRQMAFEKDLAGRVLAPMNAVLGLVDQSAAAMRSQAQAFDAASEAFKRSAQLLEVQASLLEEAGRSLRDPTRALKAAGGELGRARGRRKRD